MLNKIFLIAALFIGMCTPNVSLAQQLIGSYVALLSNADHFNSRGQRLTTAAAIIRQDRANYHRFGKRDNEDEDDRFFADENSRAGLEHMFERGSPDAGLISRIVNGTVLIRVNIYRDTSGQFIRVAVIDHPQSAGPSPATSPGIHTRTKSLRSADVQSAGPSTAASPRDEAHLPIEIVPIVSHSDSITSSAFSPGGRIFVTVSAPGATDAHAGENSIRVWDLSSGRLIRSIGGLYQRVSSTAVSSDGKWAIVELKLLDLEKGRIVRTFGTDSEYADVEQPDGTCGSVAVSPDERKVLIARRREITLWNREDGKQIAVFKTPDVSPTSAAFSPSGTYFAIGGTQAKEPGWNPNAPGMIILFNNENNQYIKTFNGHIGTVSAIAFSKDDKMLLSAGGKDRTVKLWDLETGQLVRTFSRPGADQSEASVAFLGSGDRVVASSVDGVTVWDIRSGRIISTQRLNVGGFCPALSSDGKFAIMPSQNLNDLPAQYNDFSLWNVESQSPIALRAKSNVVYSVAIQDSANRAITALSDHTIKIWDLQTGQLVQTLRGHGDAVESLGLSKDQRFLVSGGADKSIRLWSLASGEPIRIIKNAHNDDIVTTVFSSDGKRILTASVDNTTKLWNAQTGGMLQTFGKRNNPDIVAADGYMDRVFAAAFDKAEKNIVTGNADGDVVLWNIHSGKSTHADGVGPNGAAVNFRAVRSVAVSRDGTIVSGNASGTLKLWSTSGDRHGKILQSGVAGLDQVGFSSDGNMIIAADDAGKVVFWDTNTRRIVRTFTGHQGSVQSAVLTSDRSRMVTGGADGTVRVWDASTARLLATMIASADGEWLTITPEGFFAGSRRGAELLSVVRGLTAFSVSQLFQPLYRPDLVRQKLSNDFDSELRVELAAGRMSLAKVMASGAAPTVTIDTPSQNATLTNPTVAAKATIKDAGGGIGRIEWRVNGVALGVQALPEKMSGNDKAIQLEHTFQLGEGTFILELIAYNKENLVTSSPSSVVITIRPVQPAPKPNLYVLTLGVNQYRDKSLKLNFAAGDARSIAALFRNSTLGGALYDRVIVHEPLLDSQVTLDKLGEIFSELSKTVRPTDVFLLYIAGHGRTDNGYYYYLPQDANNQSDQLLFASSIGATQLEEWLASIPALRSILIIDTCESGATTRESTGFKVDQQVVAADKLSQSMGRTVFAATTDDAPAREGYQGHGIFTYVFLNGLAKANTNREGQIQVTELAKYVIKNLPVLSEQAGFSRQNPEVKVIGADFPFITRATISDIDGVLK